MEFWKVLYIICLQDILSLYLVQVAKYMKGHMGGFIESDIFSMGHSITNHPALTDPSHKIFFILPHKLRP